MQTDANRIYVRGYPLLLNLKCPVLSLKAKPHWLIPFRQSLYFSKSTLSISYGQELFQWKSKIQSSQSISSERGVSICIASFCVQVWLLVFPYAQKQPTDFSWDFCNFSSLAHKGSLLGFWGDGYFLLLSLALLAFYLIGLGFFSWSVQLIKICITHFKIVNEYS